MCNKKNSLKRANKKRTPPGQLLLHINLLIKVRNYKLTLFQIIVICSCGMRLCIPFQLDQIQFSKDNELNVKVTILSSFECD